MFDASDIFQEVKKIECKLPFSFINNAACKRFYHFCLIINYFTMENKIYSYNAPFTQILFQFLIFTAILDWRTCRDHLSNTYLVDSKPQTYILINMCFMYKCLLSLDLSINCLMTWHRYHSNSTLCH
jgi:hypothetical protein